MPETDFFDDSRFLEYLSFKELKTEYVREKKSRFSNIDKKYASDHDDIVKRKLIGIEQDKKHRMILNTAIFPFVADGELTKYGYYFVRASPLSELGVNNLDFLIFHMGPPNIAILGEAKGSADATDEIVVQMKDRMKIAREKTEFIQENYLKTNAQFEFVLCVEWLYAHEVLKTIMRKGGEIILWSSGSISLDSKLQVQEILELMIPMKEDGPEGRTMKHTDKDLNRYLHKIKTSSECKDFFVESHPFAKLTVLNYVDRGKKDCIFTFEDLMELVGDTLDYLDQETIRRETQWILDFSRNELGVVEEIDGQAGKFRISIKGKRADVREKELKKKWIDFDIKRDKIFEKKRVLAEIQERFTEKRKRMKGIDEFGDGSD